MSFVQQQIGRHQDGVRDLVVASADPVDNLPLWPIIALTVRVSSSGPALFHEKQVTKDGRILRMYKFRTLRTGGPAFDRLITWHGCTGMCWPFAWVSG